MQGARVAGALELAEAFNVDSIGVYGLSVLGFLELVLGRTSEALSQLERCAAVVELAATGASRGDQRPRSPLELTPQELRIARLVAEVATNKEAAAQLFLSPKTVGYHLGKIYAKLGIDSRAELVRLFVLQDSSAEDEPTQLAEPAARGS